MSHVFDIQENRKSRKWTTKEQVGRLIWALTWPFFRYSPKPLWRWRNFLLRIFGAQISSNVRIDPSVRIFIPWNLSIADWSSIGFDAIVYNLGFIAIGSNVTISQRSHLCAGTHDYRQKSMPLVKSTIVIGSDTWICADAFIGPDIKIGDTAIVGARSVVVRDVPSLAIVAGNPARFIKHRDALTPPDTI
jgi:putative colanic acid biosynthesis acetyltransferase WcaF